MGANARDYKENKENQLGKLCGRPILIITRMITDRIRNPLVPLPLLIAQGSLDSAIFFQNTDLARDYPALIQR